MVATRVKAGLTPVALDEIDPRPPAVSTWEICGRALSRVKLGRRDGKEWQTRSLATLGAPVRDEGVGLPQRT